jgi:hypothetical protein
MKLNQVYLVLVNLLVPYVHLVARSILPIKSTFLIASNSTGLISKTEGLAIPLADS